MRTTIACVALVISLVFGLEAFGQNALHPGENETSWSRRLSARSTPPKVGRCSLTNCFRVMIEFAPIQPETIGLGTPNRQRNLSTAYTASGSTCSGVVISGLNEYAWQNVWFPEYITWSRSTKPAIAVIDYGCDYPVTRGEEVTFQTTVLIYINSGSAGSARYIFKRVRLE
jgi:hypothetical protein